MLKLGCMRVAFLARARRLRRLKGEVGKQLTTCTGLFFVRSRQSAPVCVKVVSEVYDFLVVKF